MGLTIFICVVVKYRGCKSKMWVRLCLLDCLIFVQPDFEDCFFVYRLTVCIVTFEEWVIEFFVVVVIFFFERDGWDQ